MPEMSGIRLADTHCHLAFDDFASDLDAVVARSRAAGVGLIILPGIDLASSEASLALARGKPEMHAACGIHPSYEEAGDPSAFARISRLAFHPEVRAVGETGLELHRVEQPLPVQEESLRRHFSLARALALPLIVHSRSAERRVLEMLPADPGFPVIMHCYTGPRAEALEAASRGYFIGFAGGLTYRKNEELRQTAAALPLDRILVETDAPFMSPEPLRGKRCEPAFVAHTAARMAEIRGLAPVEAGTALFENALRAFRLGSHRRPSAVYMLGPRAYVNLTGKCNNDCTFCIRRSCDGLGGYYLRHGRTDPPAWRILAALGLLDPREFEELVFCGFGEPTTRPVELREISVKAREAGWKIRLNTNGLATSMMEPAEARTLLAPFHTVSISLNCHDRESYSRICRPSAPDAWERLLEFIAIARESGARVRLTAVKAEGVDMAATRRLASELGPGLTERG
jgi:TatD DNase family protein